MNTAPMKPRKHSLASGSNVIYSAETESVGRFEHIRAGIGTPGDEFH